MVDKDVSKPTTRLYQKTSEITKSARSKKKKKKRKTKNKKSSKQSKELNNVDKNFYDRDVEPSEEDYQKRVEGRLLLID